MNAETDVSLSAEGVVCKNLPASAVESVNLVNATITISSTNYYASAFSPNSIAAGESKVVTITFTGSLSPTAGTPYPVSLLTSEGTVQFTAIAQ